MEDVQQEAQQLDDSQGMPVPEGFADMLIQDTGESENKPGPGGEPAPETEGLTEREKAVQKATEKILEKASVMIHQAFDKGMKNQGRPGLREVPPEEAGKILVMGLPQKLKQQHPLVVYLGIMSGVLADNFVLNAPDQEPEKVEDGQ